MNASARGRALRIGLAERGVAAGVQLSDGREFEKPAQCPGILISLFRGRVGFNFAPPIFSFPPLSLSLDPNIYPPRIEGIAFLQLRRERDRERERIGSIESVQPDAFSLVDKFVTIRHAAIVFLARRY